MENVARKGGAYERVRERLAARGSSIRGQMARCPAHHDRKASLSVTRKPGRVLLHCHAGCTAEQICEVLGLTLADLFDDAERGDTDEEPPVEGPPKLWEFKQHEIAAVHEYCDDVQVCRFTSEAQQRGRSKCMSRHLGEDGRWYCGLGETRTEDLPLYFEYLAGQALRDGSAIYVVEGESDVDAVVAAGGCATCNFGGAGKFTTDHATRLAGVRSEAKIIVVADKDESGEKHARQVIDHLLGAGVERTRLHLARAKVGKDARDHLNEGLGLDALVFEEVVYSGKRWPILWAGDADGSRAQLFVIDEVIHADTVGQIWGSHGTLKTMLALDMGACVATGKPWRGHRTRKGGVIYVAAEGGGGIEGRIAALRVHHPELPPKALVAVRSAVDLRDAKECDEFARYLITEVLPQMPDPAALLVFDTLSQSMPGGDENAGKDITSVERNVRVICAKLAREPGAVAAGLLIHHGGKDSSRGPRGHSSQMGNFDFVLATRVLLDGDDAPTPPIDMRLFSLRAEKVRDGSDGFSWPYRGELVPVGVKEDGSPKFAPMVVASDADLSAIRRGSKSAKRNRNYRPQSGSLPDLILVTMREMQILAKSTVPLDVLRRVGLQDAQERPGVRRDALVERVRGSQAAYDGREVAEVAGGRKLWGSLKRVNEEIGRLVERNRIKEFEGWVWET